MPSIGQRVKHFEIIEEAGRGGMGIVFKARDTRLDRIVALKFLPYHVSQSKITSSRLLQEAKATSALNHPNILTVYDIDEAEGRVFIATEFVEGSTLRELLTRRELTNERALHLMLQMAEALRVAHARGVVHRDIKPENIMVTPEFRVKVMDFGLAITPHTDDSLARPGMIMGTTQYMAPEQVEGGTVDPRSDIFSLGIVFYEMLCGRTPFEAEFDAAALYAIVNVEPVPIDEVNPSVPPQLARLVHKCLAKSPAARYQSCEALLGELKECLTLPAIHGAQASVGSVQSNAGLPAGSRNFAGREPARERLLDEVRRAREGKGKTLLIHGEPGIGKTTLVASVAEEANADGCTVLWGRCPFQEPGLPYHPFAVAMSSHFRHGGVEMLEAMARDAERHGIPVGGRLPFIKAFLGLAPGTPEVHNKEQLWDAITLIPKILARERPVMLVLDDLQWADRTTIGLFGFMARNLKDDAILLAGIYRHGSTLGGSDQEQGNITECARQLRIDGLATEVPLGRLDRRQTENALRDLFNGEQLDGKVVDTVFSTTDGNPLFLVELVSLLKHRGVLELREGAWRIAGDAGTPALPRRVQDVIAQRLSRLSSEEKELLEIASCEGVYFRSDIILGCLGIDRMTLLKKLQRLEKDQGLIRYENQRYSFDHPLIRQVLYEGLLPELREEYHRTIAGWLIEQYAGHTDYAPSIAHHLLASGQGQGALDYLLIAASHARDLYSFENAGEFFESARNIIAGQSPKDIAKVLVVEEGLGDCALAAGRIRDALGHYDTVRTLAGSGGQESTGIAALRKSGNCLRMLGELKEAWSRCTEALARAVEARDVRSRMECLQSVSLIHIARGEYAQAADILRETLTIARAEKDALVTAQCLCNLGVARLHRGEYTPAMEHLKEAQRLQESLGDRRGLATTLNFLAIVYDRLARYGDALAAGTASLEIKESIGDVAAVPGTLNVIGEVYRDAGNVRRAVELHDRSLRLSREQGNRGSECDNARDQGLNHLLLGDLPAADQLLEGAIQLATKAGLAWYVTRSSITLGELRIAQGRKEDALRFSERGLAVAREIQANELIMEALWKRAVVLRASGSKEEGSAMLREAIDHALKLEYRNFLWQMYRDLWRACTEDGNAPEAGQAVAAARKEIEEIAHHLNNPDLHRSFMEIPGVREVMAQ